jgi:hypothetical protein
MGDAQKPLPLRVHIHAVIKNPLINIKYKNITAIAIDQKNIIIMCLFGINIFLKLIKYIIICIIGNRKIV